MDASISIVFFNSVVALVMEKSAKNETCFQTQTKQNETQTKQNVGMPSVSYLKLNSLFNVHFILSRSCTSIYLLLKVPAHIYLQ